MDVVQGRDRKAPNTPTYEKPEIAVLVGYGFHLQAISLHLSLSEAEVHAHLAAFGLLSLKSQPLRAGTGPTAWTHADIRGLIAGLSDGRSFREIGERIDRSTKSVSAKARSLGFRVRTRVPLPGSRAAEHAQVSWSAALDTELGDRWFADQHHVAIAGDMGISVGAIRSRATRIGLPRRNRAALVTQFDIARSATSALRAMLVRRKCPFSGVQFWGTRHGPRLSPLARKSRAFQRVSGGLNEACCSAPL